MKKSLAISTFVAVLLLLVSTAAVNVNQAHAFGNLSPNGMRQATSGTLTITTDTTLTEDHNGSIIIRENGITLDCGFHSVVGNGDGIGILLPSTSHVAIRQCQVRGFSSGIVLMGTTLDNSLYLNTVTHNKEYGFLLLSANDNTFISNIVGKNRWGFGLGESSRNSILDNVVSNNDDHGIELNIGSSSNWIYRNAVTNNGQNGIWVRFGTNRNEFVENVIRANKHDGFDCDNSNSNLIAENSIMHNYFNGIEFDNCHDNQIYRNIVNGNGIDLEHHEKHMPDTHHGQSGISMDTSTGNQVTENTVSFNVGNGLRIEEGSNGNTFKLNQACHNGDVDAFQEGSVNNVFINNNFCTFDGIP